MFSVYSSRLVFPEVLTDKSWLQHVIGISVEILTLLHTKTPSQNADSMMFAPSNQTLILHNTIIIRFKK